jgi:hypothetical protein
MQGASLVPFLGFEMNTGLIPLVRRALVVAAMALALPGLSQDGKGGLTKDFDKLSAKERTKIAARENQEAAVDTNYQSVMRAAESAFQDGDYEKALARFQEARKMRPYNVYPKVKIQDLQVLLKKQADEKAAQPAAVVDTAVVRPEPAAPVVAPAPRPVEAPPVAVPPPPQTATVVALAATEPPPASAPEAVKVSEPPPPPPAAPAPARVVQVPEEAPVPKTLGERIFIEAGAVVTERTVMDEDRATVYRRVVHPSGQVFTFKDGLAIPERMWDERFGE